MCGLGSSVLLGGGGRPGSSRSFPVRLIIKHIKKTWHNAVREILSLEFSGDVLLTLCMELGDVSSRMTQTQTSLSPPPW